MSEETSTSNAAAKRRAARGKPSQAEAAQAAAPLPTPEPAAPIDPTKPVVVSRAMVAEYTSHQHTGVTGAHLPVHDLQYGRPTAPMIVPVQPASNMYGTVANDQDYVTAEFEAYESMVPEGARTPVSRLLWSKGWRVHRRLYEAVAARTAPADQAAAAVSPAVLPEGVTAVPTEMVSETYRDAVMTPAAEAAAANVEITAEPETP